MSGKSFFDFYDRGKPKAAAAPTVADAGQAVSVSELTRQIDRAIKGSLPPAVLVRGEISNYKHHGASGNAYFTLKDADACIDCVMFSSERAALKFDPDDGMELLATGRVAVYAQRGKYQLYISQLQPLGVGSLELAFKKLHAKLLAEGLFAAERKKQIPKYPLRIALLTSSETAALQDMLKVFQRFSFLHLSVYHAPVQGSGAAEKIAHGIGQLNRRRDIELILLGRGGGSLEDLWAFNEESVARAVARSRIPIITGIGHEIDVSIADLIADYHAHTPTEAAQVATAQWRQANRLLEEFAGRITQALRRTLENSRHRLYSIERHEAFRRPVDRLNTLRQLLDEHQRHLTLQMQGLLARNRQRLDVLSLREAEKHPRHRLQLEKQRLVNLHARLSFSVSREFQARKQKLDALAVHLTALGPEQILRRGYSITRLKKGGQIVRTVDQVRPGARMITQLSEGQIESIAADDKQAELFEQIMKAETIRKVDVWVGKPLCWLLTRWRKFTEIDETVTGKPKKILLIKMTEQGATVLAWRAMERAIQMVGRENVYFWVFEENRPILDMMGMIPPENVIAIDAGSLWSAARDVMASLLKIRRVGIDATVDMEFFARSSAVLGYLTGAKKRVGLHRFTTEGPYRGDLMTHRVEHNPYLHVSMAYLVLVECLLRDPCETPMAKMAVPELDLQPPKLTIRGEDVQGVQEVLRATGGYVPSGPIVLLNPNASDMLPLRRWESSRFVELSRRILADFSEATVVFTGGKSEREAAEKLAGEVDSNRCFCVAGKTTLRQLFALYSISRVLVTNDSGPGHFSSLTDIAAIVLFGPETPKVFGPVGRNARAVWVGIACSPCVNAMNHRVSPCNNNVCMQMITVEQVYGMVRGILSNTGTQVLLPVL